MCVHFAQEKVKKDETESKPEATAIENVEPMATVELLDDEPDLEPPTAPETNIQDEANAIVTDTNTTTITAAATADASEIKPPSPPPKEETATQPQRPVQEEEEEDSDIEEVQLIEQPIEEIVIPDDGNDFDEPNLETLNTEEILAAQQEIVAEPVVAEELPLKPEETPIKIEDDASDRIMNASDNTMSSSTLMEISAEENIEEILEDAPETTRGVIGVMSIDGNIELMDSPHMMKGPPATKIKLNITKSHGEDKANSPRNEESQGSGVTDEAEKPAAANVKPRVKEAKLTAYPAVTKGTEKSGLCSIM